MNLHSDTPHFPARGLGDEGDEAAASDALASVALRDAGTAIQTAAVNLRSLAWDLNRKTAVQFQDLPEQEGLDSTGGKYTLVQRLVKHVRRFINDAPGKNELETTVENDFVEAESRIPNRTAILKTKRCKHRQKSEDPTRMNFMALFVAPACNRILKSFLE